MYEGIFTLLHDSETVMCYEYDKSRVQMDYLRRSCGIRSDMVWDNVLKNLCSAEKKLYEQVEEFVCVF